MIKPILDNAEEYSHVKIEQRKKEDTDNSDIFKISAQGNY